MGWLFFPKPANVKQHMDSLGTFEDDTIKSEVLDSAILHFSEYYAAIQQHNKETGETHVFALMCMLRFEPKASDGNTFGYKDIDEFMGPVHCNCPERILKLLTPTDHEYASQWRKDCWENVEKRKKLRFEDGQLVIFKNPIRFTNGMAYDKLYVSKQGRKVRFTPYQGGVGYYQISKRALLANMA